MGNRGLTAMRQEDTSRWQQLMMIKMMVMVMTPPTGYRGEPVTTDSAVRGQLGAEALLRPGPSWPAAAAAAVWPRLQQQQHWPLQRQVVTLTTVATAVQLQCHCRKLPGTPVADASKIFAMNWRFFPTLDPQVIQETVQWDGSRELEFQTTF